MCADDDTFCEADGTKLTPSAPEGGVSGAHNESPQREKPPTVTGACDACGASNADDGDGYCQTCGHKLAHVSEASQTRDWSAKGAHVGQFIVRQSADDAALASRPDGTEVLLVRGTPAALGTETEALARVGAHRSFPRVIDRGSVGSDAFLALSPPSSSAQRLAGVAHSRTVEETIASIGAILELASVVERAGFTFQPLPGDVHIMADGTLVLSRLRGAAPLPTGVRLDARKLLESLNELFLPPAILGPTSLVRLLVLSRSSNGLNDRSIAEVRSALAAAAADQAAPRTSGGVAELCDAGLWRSYNQDSTALDLGTTIKGEPFVVLVVCDGVSSSAFSERASKVAARAARDALGHFARSPDVTHEAAASAVAQAIRAAHLAICAQHVADPVSEPPGTTIAAGLIFRKRLTVGWVGDSRAYWFTARGAELLTHDHSWVNEAIARGEVKDADEVQGSLAHTITKCLGPLEVGEVPSEVEPDVRSRDLAGPGLVLLCTDGLWNYAPKPADLAAVVRTATDGTNAVDVARILVNYALARGGQDNVSVAVYAHA